MARKTLSIVAASVLIATLCSADDVTVAQKTAPTQLIFGMGSSEPAPAKGAAQPSPGHTSPSVLQSLEAALYAFASAPQNQPVIAGSFLMFGFACLIDGARSFQLLVVVSVGVIVGVFMLTQMEAAHMGPICGGIAAAEIGLFVAAAACLGWDGTQLMLGAVAGVYLYHLACGLIVLIRGDTITARVDRESDSLHEPPNVFILCGYTASILAGTFFLNDKGGAQRAFAIVAPLLGAALVASTLEYLIMFYFTTPQGGDRFTLADLPSVFDILYMIAFPTNSRAVGFFTKVHGNFSLGGRRVEVDKVIGVTAWAFLAFFGIVSQCRQISKLKSVQAKEGDDLIDEPATPTSRLMHMMQNLRK